MTPYQFLSEIYKLLGELDSATLTALRNMSIATDVRPIIEAFASAKQQRPVVNTIPTIEPAVGERKQEDPKLPSAPDQEDHSDVQPAIDELIQRAHRSLSNMEFKDLLGRSGLQIRLREKESRRSFVRRVHTEVSKLSAERRDKIFRTLLKYAQAGETEGWMQVIRSSGVR